MKMSATKSIYWYDKRWNAIMPALTVGWRQRLWWSRSRFYYRPALSRTSPAIFIISPVLRQIERHWRHALLIMPTSPATILARRDRREWLTNSAQETCRGDASRLLNAVGAASASPPADASAHCAFYHGVSRSITIFPRSRCRHF